MVWHIIWPSILLVSRIFPRPLGLGKILSKLVKYSAGLYVKPFNKIYTINLALDHCMRNFPARHASYFPSSFMHWCRLLLPADTAKIFRNPRFGNVWFRFFIKCLLEKYTRILGETQAKIPSLKENRFLTTSSPYAAAITELQGSA